MNAIHAFLLILTIAGQPQQARAICDTYKKCSDEGAQMAALYAQQFGAPRNFSYRVVPVMIISEQPTT